MGTLNLSSGVALSATGTAFGNSAASWSDAPPGTIIQTVYSGSSMSSRDSFTSSTPSEIHTSLRTSITLRKSNSVVLVTYTIGWRLDGNSSLAYILPQVSTDSGSSFSLFTDYTGANNTEMFRNDANDTYSFDTQTVSFIDWNTTAASRMYSLFCRVGAGTMYVGDNQPRPNMILHEIAQ
jgi:hypothetical protein